MQLNNPPVTVNPEDYFRYYCKDSKAIEMFYKYVDMVINGEVESYEQTVNYLKEEIRSPESEVEDLEDDRDELLIRIRDLKEELEQLENKLGG
jgi:uncharacterized coiled-coil DUF342 family protein